MNLMLKGFLSIMLLASGGFSWTARAGNCNTNNCNTDNDDCNTSFNCPKSVGNVCGTHIHFSARPQDSNVARRMVAVEDKIHRYGAEEFNGVVSVGLQYQQTFKPGKLARYLFGKESLTFGPSCDGTYDIYGTNIGTTASGRISFAPRIRNFIADIDFWLGLDEFICGSWFRVTAPVNWTQWDLRPCQSLDNPTATPVPFAPGTVAFADAGTQTSFGGALAGLTGAPFGIAPRADCGVLCCNGKTHDTAVAGLHFDLGYDFIRRECSHVGASLHVVAPTGTRQRDGLNDHCLFRAVSGAQHSWQIGATVNAAYLAWENCDGDQRLGIYFDSTITHLFKAKQRRLFNLKNRDGSTNPLSYLLLLKKFNASTGAVEGLQRAANALCCDIRVGARVMADLALMVQYDCGCFSAAVGYNFWGRSREQGSFRKRKNNDCATSCGDRCTITANTLGIKGNTSVDDATTQSTSTVGTCGPVDDAPVFLTTADIDFCSALHPRAWSNKVFGWVGWNWRDCEWQPFVALEGGAEFGHNNTAVDQWEVMLKGGVAF